MKRHVITLIFMFSLSILLVACGSGGGGTTSITPPEEGPVVTKKTVSGVAAAGAPMIGWAYLKDSSNPPMTFGPTEIAPDGSFSFDVTELKAPFYLQASGIVGGQRYNLHSVAMTDGTANINPLTNLAVAAAAGVGVNDPESVFNDPLANPITSDALAKAIADIQTMLQPLLTAYSASADFLSGDYTADSTGLDGLLDVVEVSIDTATGDVSINDKIQNAEIAAMTTTTIANPDDTISSEEAGQSVGVPTDLQEMASLLSKFATTLNKGSNLKDTDLDPYFATDFGIDDGLDRGQKISTSLANASGCNNCISSILGVAIKEKKDNGDYIIAANFYGNDGSIYRITEFTVTKEDNAWKFKGSGYKSYIEVYPSAGKLIDSNGSVSSVSSGIRVDIADPGNLGLQSAIITGPGLPDQGIEMAKGTPDVVALEPVGWDESSYHAYSMSDALIETLPETDLTYTIIIKDVEGSTVETRTVTLPQRPYKVSEINSSYFLQISGIPNHNTSSLQLGGGTLSFTYVKPTAYQVGSMNMELGYIGINSPLSGDYTEIGLSLSGTSANIVTPGLPGDYNLQYGWLRADVWDLFGRDMVVEWIFRSNSTTPFEGSQPPVESPTIVGTWYGGDTMSRGFYVMTFFADGTYIMADDDSLTTNDDPNNPICQPGIEHGTYTWKPDTGAFSAKPTLTDTNGECGFSTGDDSPATANVTISGDIMTQDMGDSGGIHQLTRLVPDSGNPIVGTWYAGNPGSRDGFSVGIFFENSTYVIADDGAQAGMEHGAYTWDPATGAFTASASLADSNGDWGFNNTSSADNVTATISGDTLTHTYPGEGVYTATRLVP